MLSAMASFYADPMEPSLMNDKATRELACIRLIAKIVRIIHKCSTEMTGSQL